MAHKTTSWLGQAFTIPLVYVSGSPLGFEILYERNVRGLLDFLRRIGWFVVQRMRVFYHVMLMNERLDAMTELVSGEGLIKYKRSGMTTPRTSYFTPGEDVLVLLPTINYPSSKGLIW